MRHLETQSACNLAEDDASFDAYKLPTLCELCVSTVAKHSAWQVQKRSLQILPEVLANPILTQILRHLPVTPAKLAPFQDNATEYIIDGRHFGSPSPASSDWLLAACQFRHLQRVTLSFCPKLRDEHVRPLASVPPTLTHLALTSCHRISTAVIEYVCHLPALESLALPDCAQSERLPPSISSLNRSLTALDLGGHKLSDADAAPLATLTRLESLALWGNEITQGGIEFTTRLARLTALDVSWTYVSHPPPLPMLERLDLQHCEVGGDWQGTYALAMSSSAEPPFSRVTYLNLRSSRFECVMPYKVGEELLLYLLDATRGSLRHLHLEDARLSTPGIAPTVAALPPGSGLRCLDLSGVPLGGLSALEHLSALQSLERLTLRRCHTTDADAAAISRAPSLVALSLSDSAITDAGLLALTALTRLTRVTIAGDSFRGLLGPKRPKRPKPAACGVGRPERDAAHDEQTPWLDGTAMRRQPDPSSEGANARSAEPSAPDLGGDAAPAASWAAFRALLQLDLQGRQLTGACRQVAAALTQLTSLLLDSRSIGDGSVECVAALPRLRRLSLLGATMSKRGMYALLDAPALQHVELRWCSLLPDALALSDDVSAALLARRGRLVIDGAEVPVPQAGASAAAVVCDAWAHVDERLKYSREKLLALKQLPACRGLPTNDAGQRVALPAQLASKAW